MQARFADALKTNITDSEFDAVESVAEKIKSNIALLESKER